MNDQKTNKNRILLVEDEALIALSEKQSLEKHSYEVVTVYSGEKAVQTATEDTEISLVLMDIDLGGGIDGTEAAQQILEVRSLPIVFLTSHSEREYVERVKKITSYGYVLKSSGEFVLLRSIEMAFELFSSHEREKERRREYKQLLQSSEEPTASYDEHGRVLIMNERAAKNLGGVPEDFVGKTLSEILPHASAERGLATIEHVFQTGEAVRRESSVTIDGAERWFDMRFSPIRNDAGEIYAVLQMSLETTQTRAALEASRAAEERYRLLAENSLDGILLLDRNLKPTYMSPAAIELSGRTVDDYVDRTALDDIHPDDREQVESELERAIREGEQRAEATYRVVASDGTVRWRRTKTKLLYDDSGAFDGAVVADEDITERKRLEDKLRESERTLRLLAENAHDILALFDLEFRVQYIAPATQQFGYSAEELLDGGILSVIHPDDREAVQKAFADVLQTPEKTSTVEHRILTKSGESVWMESTGKRFEDEHGNTAGVVVVARDTTERKMVEASLKESEEKYRLLAENTVDIVYSLDAQLRPTYISPSIETLLGYPPEHFNDASIFDSVVPEHTERVAGAIKERIAAGESFGVAEFAVRNADGNIRWVENRARYIYTEDGELSKVVGILRDITDRKKAEEELQAMLEYKDQLMSELNHRVKNNLAMVISLVRLKQSAVSDVVDLSDITNQINTIRSLHEKLQHSQDVSHVDAAPYLEDVVRSAVSHEHRPDVELEIAIEHVTLPTKTATTLGLIISELATNVVKHGFGAETKKLFAVTMETEEDTGEHVLTVSNTGPEFPPEIDLENSPSLGLQLITALTGQLGGTLELQRSPNPVFTIRFPIPE
jgi:PAS domain S-box-containing protein